MSRKEYPEWFKWLITILALAFGLTLVIITQWPK